MIDRSSGAAATANRAAHSFLGGRRGSLLAWAAFLMVPLLGFVGLGVDAARGYMVRARLSQSLDAAALAAGRQTSDTSKAEEAAKMVFRANFPPSYMDAVLSGPTVTFNSTADTVTASASAVLPTYFVHFLGYDTFTVSASSEVTRKTVFMDVVVSIDVSGSMGSFIGGVRKIDAAAEAARTLVDVLFGAADKKDLLKMGLLTWNSNVRILNIGQNYVRSQTMLKILPVYKDPYDGKLRTSVWFAKGSPVPLRTRPASGWTGCVHARFLNPLDGNDADITLGTAIVGGKQWMSWKPAFKSGTSGKAMQCPAQGIQRLTNIRGQMISAIQQVKNPGGNTNLTAGLMWAWRLLGTPGSPFAGDGTAEPEPGEGELIRAIVLMTDGANTQDQEDAYEGYLSASRLNDRTKAAALKIKEAGVVIYAIQFGFKSGPQEALMKQIASGPGAPYYQYAPDAPALQAAFQKVGESLSKLRISK